MTKPESSMASWLKILAVLATILGSAMGAYKAARSDAKTEAAVSYATMKESIEHLEQNQKMLWDLIMSRAKLVPLNDRELPKPLVLRPLPKSFDDMMAQRK